MGYRQQLAADIARWQAEGLIDSETGARLAASPDPAQGRFDVPRALALMAALLVSAALLTLVAANWDQIGRPLRLGLLMLLIWGPLLAGGWRLSVGDGAVGHSLVLVSAVAFGASILLFGQMYYLDGETWQGVLIWLGGALLCAGLLRSVPTLMLALGLVVFLLFDGGDDRTATSWVILASALATLLIAWLLAMRWNSRPVRHGVVLVKLLWLGALMAQLDIEDWFGPVLAVGGMATYMLSTRLPALTQRFTGFGAELPGYGVAMAVGGLIIAQMSGGFFPAAEWGSALAFVQDSVWALLAIALAAWCVLDRGTGHAGVRWTAYVGFALATLTLAVSVGTDELGTAGILLLAGLMVAALTVLARRVQRRRAMIAQTGAGVP